MADRRMPARPNKPVLTLVHKEVRRQRAQRARQQRSAAEAELAQERKRLKQLEKQAEKDKKRRKDKSDVRSGKKRAVLQPGDDMEEIECESGDDVETFEEEEERKNGVSFGLGPESPTAISLTDTSPVNVHHVEGHVKHSPSVIYQLLEYLKSRDDEYGEAGVAEIKEALGYDLSDERNDRFRESLRGNRALLVTFPDDDESVWDGFKVQRKDPLRIYNKKGLERLFTERLPRGEEFVTESGASRLTITEKELSESYRDIGRDIDHLIEEHKICTLPVSASSKERVFFPAVPGVPASPSICKLWHSIKVPQSTEELEEKLLENGVLSKELLQQRKDKRLRILGGQITAREKEQQAVQEKKRQKQLDKHYQRTGRTLARPSVAGNLSDLVEMEAEAEEVKGKN